MAISKTIHGNIVDISGRRIFPGTVTICEGRIADIKEDSSKADGSLPFILPGFIDSHIHIESTLMVPENYARLAVANGIVGAVCDPHEIANVLGVSGIEYMIENGKNARFNFYYAAPSCVPSTPFETAGAAVNADDIKELMCREDIVALGEMMNVPGVVYEDEEVLAKIKATSDAGKPVDGHAPKTSGEMLQKYVKAGISTDHECSTLEEAKEKIALGVKIIIREGSAACDFDSLYPLIKEFPGMTMFCSDDMYPDDAATIGYINGMVRRAIDKGMPLWETLECACVTPVKHYGLGCGMLHEGDNADFIVVKDLNGFEILATYVKGEEVYNAEVGVTESLVLKGGHTGPDGTESPEHKKCSQAGTSSIKTPNLFNAKQIGAKSLKVKLPEKVNLQEGMAYHQQIPSLKVITAKEGSLLTGKELVKPTIDAEGYVSANPDEDIAKIVVYNRYEEAAPQVAFIKGFGLKCGAIASTIAHDCHNIIAVGCSDEAIAEVINRLVKEKGGIAACSPASEGRKVDGCEATMCKETVSDDISYRADCNDNRDWAIECLPLPVAGLMGTMPPEETALTHTKIRKIAKHMGCKFSAPFMTMAFMALPVIPELKLTDKGLFDGNAFCFTSLWE